MADIQVFDSKNKDRLLGTLEVPSADIRGDKYEVALVKSPTHYRMDYINPPRSCVERLLFDVEWTRRTLAESSFCRTVEEKARMTTDIPLSTLMKLDRFLLPDETKTRANARRKNSDFY